MQLAEDGSETVLTYQVKAQVGGKLAQIGSRLIDSTAKKYANDFFTKFVEIVGDGGQEPAAETEAAPETPAGEEVEAAAENAAPSAAAGAPPPSAGAEPAPRPREERPSAALEESEPSAAEVDDGMKESEPADDTRQKATQAALDAVESRHGKPKAGLSGMTWVLVVIVAALILLGVFAGT